MNLASPFDSATLVIAAVRVVLPWSTWPIVPTFTCGFVRSNFALAMISSLAFHFRNDLFRFRLRYFLVVAELHRIDRAALAHRAQRGGVAEHLRQGHARPDDVRAGPLRHPADLAAAAGEIAHHLAHVLGGRHHLDVHDRLEQHRGRAARRFLHRHRARDLERHLAGVDVVVGAVDQLYLHIHHRIAGEDAVLERLLHPLLHRPDVLPRDRAPDDLVLEDEAGARRPRLEVDDHVAVLAAAPGLPDEPALDVFDALADGLAVGDLGPADVGLHLELALHPVHDDLEVQLAHPGDDRLVRLRVGVHAEGGVLFGELRQGHAELVLVGLGLGLDRDRDHRLGEAHRLEDDRVLGVAQGVTGLGVLEADRGGDVPRAYFLQLFALVGVHLQQPADALLAIFGAVVDV